MYVNLFIYIPDFWGRISFFPVIFPTSFEVLFCFGGRLFPLLFLASYILHCPSVSPLLFQSVYLFLSFIRLSSLLPIENKGRSAVRERPIARETTTPLPFCRLVALLLRDGFQETLLRVLAPAVPDGRLAAVAPSR